MITYLQKYNQLPEEIRAKISAPEVLSAISEIEKRHNVSLAGVVMRVMVRDLAILDLIKYFVFEYNLDGRYAADLVDELKIKVFAGVSDYLGFKTEEEPSFAKAIKDKTEGKTGERGADLEKWMKDRERAAAVRSSNFFFSSEDEEEVRELAKTVEDVEGREAAKDALYSEKARKVIEKTKVSLSSEELINRLKQVIKTFFRGTRNRIDTRLALQRAVNRGGLGLDDQAADRIITEAAEVKELELNKENKIAPPVKIKVPEDQKDAANKKDGQPEGVKKSGVRDMDYDFSKLAGKKPPISQKTKDDKLKLTSPKSLLPAINLKDKEFKAGTGVPAEKDGIPKSKDFNLALIGSDEKLPDPEEAVIDLKNKERPDTPEIKKEIAAADSARKPALPSTPESSQTGSKLGAAVKEWMGADRGVGIAEARKSIGADESKTPAGKIKMEDIKYVPKTKLMGPLDELKEMNLVDFRRLSDDPTVAAKNIKEKIKLLEADSYGLRLAGVKAWRESSIYKLYLKIGQKSIGRHKSIEAVINEREKEGKDTLSNDEFTAIMDLNKDLRF